MRYIVRAVPERSHLIDALRSEIPELEIAADRTRNAIDTLMTAMSMAGDGPCVHLEDDVRLASNFKERAEALIEQRPDVAINFFSRHCDDVVCGARMRAGSSFFWSIAFYFPRGYSREILSYHWPHRSEHQHGVDLLIRGFLMSRRASYFQAIPNLADHRPIVSAVNPLRSLSRVSLTFKG